jgi:DNA-binding response OmpR family regulator
VCQADRYLRCQSVTLDQQKRRVVVCLREGDDLEAELTANEAALLAHMMQYPDVVFSCVELARAALGYNLDRDQARSIVRPHVSRLRRKIEPNPLHPTVIQTIRGKGYVFSPP